MQHPLRDVTKSNSRNALEYIMQDRRTERERQREGMFGLTDRQGGREGEEEQR